MNILKTCAQCNKEIKVRPERLKEKNFCSKTCTGKNRNKQISLNCFQCGKVFKRSLGNIHSNKHFCDRKCVGKFQTGPQNPKWVEIKYKNCIVCGTEIKHDRAADKRRKCCSKRCATISMSGKRHYLWNGGLSNKDYPLKFNKYLKAKIKKRDGYKCQSCGLTQEESKSKTKLGLDVHHIDSNKMNCDESNLITTCRKCNIGARKIKKYWESFYKQKINEILQQKAEV